MRRRIIRTFAYLFLPLWLTAQWTPDSISSTYVRETLFYLTSDSLGGRVNYSPQQAVAAKFLADEFRQAGLEPFPGAAGFLMSLSPGGESWNGKARLTVNEERIEDSSFLFFNASPAASRRSLKDFLLLQVFPPVADSLLYRNWQHPEPVLLQLVLPPGMPVSEAIASLHIPPGRPASDLLLFLYPEVIRSLRVASGADDSYAGLNNVIAWLPGTEKPEEFILFSAHYDHVDHGPDGKKGEIYNGANDNASGTTAVLALARYYAKRRDNKRSLLFCLFAGEELGLLGSTAFVQQVNADRIQAVINIEMIGMTNASGKNSMLLTGPAQSNLLGILEKNLKGYPVKIRGLFQDDRQLFERSDNYPFYQYGIPAHTLLCSDDRESCYHRPCDDAKRIDTENMTRVIRAIAVACQSLVEGRDTPRL